jgi:large subunit ribosomal protein L7Ae
VRLQRQKKILLQRIKSPPAINQFNKTLDKNGAAELFKLLAKYKPETKAEKAERLEATANGKAPTEAPVVLKSGLKHVTTLIEEKKAELVIIAHDVDPIELVIWLPALCRKMKVPFCIVKGRARLGALTNMKTCSVVALTKVNAEDSSKFSSIKASCTAAFNDKVEKKWSNSTMGVKTEAMLTKRRQALEAEEAKKALSVR